MRLATTRQCGRVRAAGAAFFGLAFIAVVAAPACAQSLKGSKNSLDLQNRVATEHGFTYIRTSDQARWFVDNGYLVRLRGGAGYELKRMSHPYARPEVALFVSRLGPQYQAACGERLVVTSLTRPTTRQPRNASSRSVHPTGMAMDLRRSNNRACRSWLESVLLRLEGAGVLEATRERSPPHFHVALFPSQYDAYVDRKMAAGPDETEREYIVRRGDSLWSIARRHGTDVSHIREANDLRGSRIYEGQLLTVPTDR
ncbi:MAG: LysM peptidoglycan-binding domain-containing protein [Gemmatimonadetes bacterium]|nr:LysM peptidoglycan-binding domain-containing protein [Gemmatimonadota bacterium]NNK48833.1 LysM peptidoglycan-binding domain-containing protein [Gemmatimonadota bacterium]